MGLPAVLAPGEAERLCAQLALNGLAQAAATEAVCHRAVAMMDNCGIHGTWGQLGDGYGIGHGN